MTVRPVIELNQIRALLAVADHGGFRAAAQGLDLSQSAVSRAVARLEDGLGATLIVRRPGRRAQLTAAGRIFAEAAKRALFELQTGASEVSRLAHVSAGSLRVLMTGELTRGGRALFEAFRKTAPDVLITFREVSPGKARRLLESGRADAYFAADALLAASLEQIPLWEERLMLVVPDAHPQAVQSSLSTSGLRSETLIILGARGEDYSAILAKQFGFPIRHVTRQGTFNDTLTEALFGGGVIVAPRGNVESVPSGLLAIPLRGRGSTIRRVLGWAPTSEKPVTGRLVAFVRDTQVKHEIAALISGRVSHH